MIKWFAIGGGLVVLAAIGVAALGTKAAMDVDYRSLDDEAQQHFLDGVAKGFTNGFEASARGQARITYITANATSDIIAVDVKFTNPGVEQATYEMTENLKRGLYSEYCNYFAGEKLNDSGVTLKMRLLRPSGGPLATVAFNQESCASHRKAASARAAERAS